MPEYQFISSRRGQMELPQYEWRRKDAGIIRDWWKARIEHLCHSGNHQEADALYKEFDLSDD